MEVELHPHCGTNLATGRLDCFEMWQVVVVWDNGTKDRVGFLGWSAGSIVSYTNAKIDPITRAEITSKISVLLDEEKTSKTVEDIPIELIENHHKPGSDNVFDESDFT